MAPPVTKKRARHRLTNVAMTSARPGIRCPRRDEAIGVLVDDLVTRGTQEPYCMLGQPRISFTAAEDNADLRYYPKHMKYLVDEQRWEQFQLKREAIAASSPAKTLIHPVQHVQKLEPLLEQPLAREYHMMDLFDAPTSFLSHLVSIEELGPE